MLFQLFCIAVLLVAASDAERPKMKDPSGHFLVRITDIPVGSCGGDSYFGLGMMNGTLEKCSMWQETDADKQLAYEEYKCKHLRMHAEVVDGKCQCKAMWKGAICNEFHGCPEGHSAHNKVCTPNICQHDGELAVGGREIECICKVPWDGRTCERLACWRKTKFGQDKRFANSGKSECKCGRHYEGENCDIIKSCHNNAELIDGKCQCPEGYGGEICDRTCPKGQVTCSATGFGSLFFLSFLMFAATKFY